MINYYIIKYANYEFYAILDRKNEIKTRIYVGGKKKDVLW